MDLTNRLFKYVLSPGPARLKEGGERRNGRADPLPPPTDDHSIDGVGIGYYTPSLARFDTAIEGDRPVVFRSVRPSPPSLLCRVPLTQGRELTRSFERP